MTRIAGKALVAQGGGPTVVINQSVAGVVSEARRFPDITAVYGALNGVRGIAGENFLDLSYESEWSLARFAATPSSGLLSTRDKPDAAYCARMFDVMRAHDIRYFFYVGGNDSSDTVRIVSEQAKAENYDLRAIHIPKTIDNDLMENDHCPGFGSAARFVSEAFSGANLDNRALGGIYIGVVMGRHAGFLTASAALAKTYDDDGPHLIYLPERAFDETQFLADVKDVHDRLGRCVIAVSEGISDASGTPVITRLMGEERDAHGNIQLSGTGALGDLLSSLIKEKLGLKRVRADTFGYIQRCYPSSVSDVDAAEAREAGEMAVRFAMLGNQNGSVAIRRIAENYAVRYDLVPLQNVAGKTRHMPEAHINAAGNHITPEFISWCRPLIGSGVPTAHRLRAPAVAKK
ncbi:MAG: 6-phosphofructokinase [Verrucomicrobiota bacterium]